MHFFITLILKICTRLAEEGKLASTTERCVCHVGFSIMLSWELRKTQWLVMSCRTQKHNEHLVGCMPFKNYGFFLIKLKTQCLVEVPSVCEIKWNCLRAAFTGCFQYNRNIAPSSSCWIDTIRFTVTENVLI